MQYQTIIKKTPSPEAIEKVHRFIAERREMIVSRLLEARGKEAVSRNNAEAPSGETA